MKAFYCILLFVLPCLATDDQSQPDFAELKFPDNLEQFHEMQSAPLNEEQILKQFNGASHFQCALRCRLNANCEKSATYVKDGSNVCILLKKDLKPMARMPNKDAQPENNVSTPINEAPKLNLKKAVPLKRPTFKSCKEAFDNGFKTDGFRRLESGVHFCNTSLGGNCGEGSWTLALGSDGSKKTFAYDALWTDMNLYHPTTEQPFEVNETKYPAYFSIKMKALCLVIRWPNGETKALKFTDDSLKNENDKLEGKTLLDVMKGGTMETKLGRKKFLSLNTSEIPIFDPNCNREGFNVMSNDVNFGKMRLGFLMDNDEGDCPTVSSFIGIGYLRQPDLYWDNKQEIYAGGACNWDTYCQERKVVAAWAYLFVL